MAYAVEGRNQAFGGGPQRCERAAIAESESGGIAFGPRSFGRAREARDRGTPPRTNHASCRAWGMLQGRGVAPNRRPWCGIQSGRASALIVPQPVQGRGVSDGSHFLLYAGPWQSQQQQPLAMP
jgi:hypothetical protein